MKNKVVMMVTISNDDDNSSRESESVRKGKEKERGMETQQKCDEKEEK